MTEYDRTTGEPWNDADLDQLRILAAEDKALGVIAVQLGRTEEAVKNKANAEGISLMGG
ncbi:hypothetical protein [Sulfitobacter delicatus]|jgi:hypothetical protein|uniref:GcrA cell cycle regulator n=1 Tax=Sulfitobacter delicatus TaxID=218672 RepID=A0A1G7HP60_9RHOB|nr:hypothetical protein [Sulfitobacter delicatus]SDF02235.1 hypothetical protein SAMN04489759_101181 [Sulfitobacter delicatus]